MSSHVLAKAGGRAPVAAHGALRHRRPAPGSEGRCATPRPSPSPAARSTGRRGCAATPPRWRRWRPIPRAGCLALWRGKPLLATGDALGLAWLPLAADIFAADGTPAVFLGLDDGAPRFAREIPDWDAAAPPAARPFLDEARESHPSLPESFRFGDLRAVMAELGPADAAHRRRRQGALRLARDPRLLRQLRRAARR